MVFCSAFYFFSYFNIIFQSYLQQDNNITEYICTFLTTTVHENHYLYESLPLQKYFWGIYHTYLNVYSFIFKKSSRIHCYCIYPSIYSSPGNLDKKLQICHTNLFKEKLGSSLWRIPIDHSNSGFNILIQLVCKLKQSKVLYLGHFRWIVRWNANSKNCHIKCNITGNKIN